MQSVHFAPSKRPRQNRHRLNVVSVDEKMALALRKRCISVLEPVHIGSHQRSAPMHLKIPRYARQEIFWYIYFGRKMDQNEIRPLCIVHHQRSAAHEGQ